MQIAEDIVQDTLLEAVERWSLGNIPDNPGGWLMDVAKKKTINLLRRDQIFRDKVAVAISRQSASNFELEYDEEVIRDSTLKMIFTCCHPDLPPESQIALALKSLCGLSVAEIASGLLTTEANINKRLYRAKEKFRKGFILFEVPAEQQLPTRLNRVCKVLYLLFNEGYFSSHPQHFIRQDLCEEAIRLATEMANGFSMYHEMRALVALMYFQQARADSRVDNEGEMILLEQQDRSTWDMNLVAHGIDLLQASMLAERLGPYHLKAAIAAQHCIADNFEQTNWESISTYYDLLLTIEKSPVVLLNRAIAYYFSGKREMASDLIQEVGDLEDLKNYAPLHAFRAWLATDQGEYNQAKTYYENALRSCASETQKKVMHQRMAKLPID